MPEIGDTRLIWGSETLSEEEVNLGLYSWRRGCAIFLFKEAHNGRRYWSPVMEIAQENIPIVLRALQHRAVTEGLEPEPEEEPESPTYQFAVPAPDTEPLWEPQPGDMDIIDLDEVEPF